MSYEVSHRSPLSGVRVRVKYGTMIILRDVFFLYFKSQIEFLPYVFCVIEMILLFHEGDTKH